MAIDTTESPRFEITITKLSKGFNKQKLFSELSFSLKTNETLAITGANGSGKSTLLRILAGVLPPTKGTITISKNNKIVSADNLHQHINICAPYLDLIDEFTLREHLTFHSKFKEEIRDVSLEETIQRAGLHHSYSKLVAEFSSGMKQRLKLILSLCFVGDILLLDEPTSHLDQAGKKWYQDIMKVYSKNRITIIFSNEPSEYTLFTKKFINIGV
ncbi:MAG: ABC-type multidrug transport system ATPase subunit [Marivirga sp.]|jgi:ABC-type multidrug transport system ATPase subunit